MPSRKRAGVTERQTEVAEQPALARVRPAEVSSPSITCNASRIPAASRALDGPCDLPDHQRHEAGGEDHQPLA
jgi:hypothetical protein